MNEPNPVLTFSFSLEHGMSDSEIEKLWKDTQHAQYAVDKFLAGEVSEQEMTDILSFCSVNLDQTRETMDNNARLLGFTSI